MFQAGRGATILNDGSKGREGSEGSHTGSDILGREVTCVRRL